MNAAPRPVRSLLSIAIVAVFALPTPGLAQNIDRIAFGSCGNQDKPQPIWAPILADAPDVFLFLGDNVYADTDDPAQLQASYDKLRQIPGFQKLMANTTVMAIWDDHDYGQNDIGRDYVAKEASRRILLDFFNEPEDSERRTRPDGIYTAQIVGDQGRRVQIILLDLRWNRTNLPELASPEQLASREAMRMGPYDASLGIDANLLGESQWQWFEEQLQQDADLRIIGSSIQLLPEFTGWETWANYPRDRLRFFELLERHQSEPILILSGDVHWAEYSEIRHGGLPWPLLELTSSGLTEEWKDISPNRHRVGDAFAVANYGLVDIDWSGETPEVTLRIKDEDGKVLIERVADFR